MTRIFDWIEKYKFGLIGTVAGYIMIFTYLQMSSYTEYFPISPFHEGPELQKEPEIVLQSEQIEVPSEFASEVKNMVRDKNDTRDKSLEKYSQDQPTEGGAKSVKDLEKQILSETGGEAKRAQILKEAEEKRKKLEEAKKTGNNKTSTSGSEGSANVYKGNVMVDYELVGRQPHLNKKWYVRNPGYTCGQGSGYVVIDISVNENGSVSSAKYNASQSRNASPCMIEQAQKYALISRFDYNDASKNQAGKIFYTFVSQ